MRESPIWVNPALSALNAYIKFVDDSSKGTKARGHGAGFFRQGKRKADDKDCSKDSQKIRITELYW